MAIGASPVEENLLELRVKVVFDIRAANKFVNTARWKPEQKTFKTHSRSRFVYWRVAEPSFVKLNVAKQ